MPKIMGRKGKEMSPDLKKVVVDLLKNGEKISDIARVLQQPRSAISDIIRRFRKAGTVENRSRSGRPPAMDDRDYRQLEKIVKTERRAPLGEIAAKFNEERIVSVSKTDGKTTFKGSWNFQESVQV
jgi:transposase